MSSLDVSKEEGPNEHQPIPASSSLPSSSSTSTSSSHASSSLLWPFSAPNLTFYFDPYSAKAAAFKTNFERKALKSNSLSSFTSNPSSASYILLDPDCDENVQLRSLPHVVALEWFKDSFLAEEALLEKDYALPQPIELEELEEEEEDQEDLVEDEEDDPTLYVDARYASRGAWLAREEEDLVRFLASKPPHRDEGGRTVWEQYAKMHPARTADAYKSRLKDKRAYFEARIAELQAAEEEEEMDVWVEIEVEAPEVQQEEEGRSGSSNNEGSSPPVQARRRLRPNRYRTSNSSGSGSGSEYAASSHGSFVKEDREKPSSSSSEEEEEAEESDSSDASSELEVQHALLSHNSSPSSSSSSPKKASLWTKSEKKKLASLIFESPDGTFAAAARLFHELHPHRTVKAILEHRRINRDTYERYVRRLRDREEESRSEEDEEDEDGISNDSSSEDDTEADADVGPSSVDQSHTRWSEEEDQDFVRMLALRGEGSLRDVYRAFAVKYPGRGSSACVRRHQKYRDRIDREIKEIRKREKGKSRGRAISESVELSEEEEEQEQGPVASSSNSPIKRARSHHGSSASPSKKRRIRVESPSPPPQPPSNAVASSSSFSSSFFALNPPPSQRRVSFSLPSSSNHHNPSFFDQRPRPPPFQPANYQQLPPVPPAPAPAPPPPPQPHPHPPRPLEPPSFLIIGTKSSTCPPSSSTWCFFCGNDESQSNSFTLLSLATKSLNDSTTVVSVPGRLACESCQRTYERRLGEANEAGAWLRAKEGEGGGEGEEEREMGRLSWATERLVAEGLERRRVRVEGR